MEGYLSTFGTSEMWASGYSVSFTAILAAENSNEHNVSVHSVISLHCCRGNIFSSNAKEFVSKVA